MKINFLIKYSIIFMLTLVLMACGQGTLTVSNLTEIDMQAGSAVEVNPGDRLIPVDENTRFNVTHVLEDGTKSVTIIRGSATLIRGNYGISG